MSKPIAVTGATGFVGEALCRELVLRDMNVRALSRERGGLPSREPVSLMVVGDIGAATDWSAILPGVDCMIHCAARVHVMQEVASDALAAYRAVNVAGTRRLAEQSAAMGVRRLVFLSSVKVNGEQTSPGQPFHFSDVPAPEDYYGISKWEAEQALWEVSARTGLEVVVVRPPLVYGPRVKGNFLQLLQLVARGLPLPLWGVNNVRSLVGVDNLIDLLIRCVDHPAAAGQMFLVSDGDQLSTPDLIRGLAKAMGKSARLWPLPVDLLHFGGRVAGKQAQVERLIGSLEVDSVHTCEALSWTPPMSVQAQLQKTVDWFCGHL